MTTSFYPQGYHPEFDKLGAPLSETVAAKAINNLGRILHDLCVSNLPNDDWAQFPFLLYCGHPLGTGNMPLFLPGSTTADQIPYDNDAFRESILRCINHHTAIGIQPLIRVLDALIPHSPNTTTSAVHFRFLGARSLACSTTTDALQVADHSPIIQGDVRIVHLNVFNTLHDHDNPKNGRVVFPQLTDPQYVDTNINDALFQAPSPLLYDLLSGLVHICRSFSLPTNSVTQQSLAGGVVCLSELASIVKAKEALVLLTRPPNVWTPSTGSVVFCTEQNKFIGRELIERITSLSLRFGYCLHDTFSDSTSQQDIRNELHGLINSFQDELDQYAATHRAFDVASDPNPASDIPDAIDPADNASLINDLASQADILQNCPIIDAASDNTLAHKIITNGSNSSPYSLPKHAKTISCFETALSRFLLHCEQFVGRWEENRRLRFALVLADPFALRYWPGARPLPLARVERSKHSDLSWMSYHALLDEVYLTENPNERAIVIPYTAFGIGHSAIPAFVVDMTTLRTAMSNWPFARIWRPESAIYSYLTMQQPSAIAAIIGPESRGQLFIGGAVAAIRGSRGWYARNNVAHIIDNVLGTEPLDSLSHEAQLIHRILPVIEQSSRFVRDDAGGGLFLWAMDKDDYKSVSNEMRSPPPNRLSGHEWLKGRRLFRNTASNNVEDYLDCAVAKQILRASACDGAVCLAGDNAEVVGFARIVDVRTDSTVNGNSVVIPTPGEDLLLGTKRAAARDFVRHIDSAICAITSSSSGPVRIWTPEKTNGDVYLFDSPDVKKTG